MTTPTHRFTITNASRLRHEYRADIEVDGRTVGYVERAQSGRGGGFRAGQYRAHVGNLIVATGSTLAELRTRTAQRLNMRSGPAIWRCRDGIGCRG